MKITNVKVWNSGKDRSRRVVNDYLSESFVDEAERGSLKAYFGWLSGPFSANLDTFACLLLLFSTAEQLRPVVQPS